MPEQFVNDVETTISAIDDSSTSLTVTSAASMPATGTFRIRIESEIVLVTVRTGNVLTVTRGEEGTTAVAHAGGEVARIVLTAAGIAQFKADILAEATGGTPGGSLGGPSIDVATVVQVDGVAGHLPVIATDVECTGNASCQPRTLTRNYSTVGNAQETAFSAPTITVQGGYKINVAVVAWLNDGDGGVSCASWDISLLINRVNSAVSIQGNVPNASGLVPDNDSGQGAVWRATVDLSGNTPRVRVTTPNFTGVKFGIVYQVIKVV